MTIVQLERLSDLLERWLADHPVDRGLRLCATDLRRDVAEELAERYGEDLA